MRTPRFPLVLLATGALAHTNLKGSVGNQKAKSLLSSSSAIDPEKTADLLAKVADQWQSEVNGYAECKGYAAVSGLKTVCPQMTAFVTSCGTVSNAVIKSSSGEHDVVKEYSEKVCGQKVLAGWKKESCSILLSDISLEMSRYDYDEESNKNLNVDSICQRFWQSFGIQQKELVAEEKAEKAAESKRQQHAHQDAEAKQAQEQKQHDKHMRSVMADKEASETTKDLDKALGVLAKHEVEADKVEAEARKVAEQVRQFHKHAQELHQNATGAAPVNLKRFGKVENAPNLPVKANITQEKEQRSKAELRIMAGRAASPPEDVSKAVGEAVSKGMKEGAKALPKVADDASKVWWAPKEWLESAKGGWNERVQGIAKQLTIN